MEDCEIIVSKEPAARPAKEGLNARQRRKQRKRAERLASSQHLDFVRKALIKKRTKQANRWVDHQTRSNQIPGLENEIRWGLKTRKPWLLTDDGQAVFDRLEREMSAALARLNKEKKAVDPDAEDETWVDDWFGEANVGNSTTGTGTGITSFSLAIRTAPSVKKEEEEKSAEMGLEDNEDEGGKRADKEGDLGHISDVEMGESGV